MDQEILEFTALGSPRDLARTIEESSVGHGSLNAIVVPWESDQTSLSMAVTSVKTEGWAIEHTNLGTIKLIGLGDDTTRVAISFHEPDHAEKKKMLKLFEGFARNIQTKLQATT